MTFTFNTLIERLEGLTGPCRECDCLIALEAGWDVQNMSLPLSDLVKRFGFEWLHEAATEYNSIYKTLPAYTASIDAAMTLVPEGWTADVRKYPNGRGFAVLSQWSPPCESEKSVDDATPAIALCIAALKARGLGQ